MQCSVLDFSNRLLYVALLKTFYNCTYVYLYLDDISAFECFGIEKYVLQLCTVFVLFGEHKNFLTTKISKFMVCTVDQEFFGGKIFRRLNFCLALFLSL